MNESRAGFRQPSKEGAVTVADMADARDAGYADGFKQGQEEGYKAGFDSGKTDLQAKMDIELTKIRQLVQAMQHPFQGFRDELVAELKSVASDICEVFLHHHVTKDQALLEFLIDEAVKQLLPTDHQIVIHVNPHNAEVVSRALEQHLEPDSWRVQVNNKLSDGNVYLESGHSRVKIDLQKTLKEYMEQIREIKEQ